MEFGVSDSTTTEEFVNDDDENDPWESITRAREGLKHEKNNIRLKTTRLKNANWLLKMKSQALSILKSTVRLQIKTGTQKPTTQKSKLKNIDLVSQNLKP